ncbi:hypothetical protein TWF694_011614 [Orbilia ellipsospora]|uniref:F-box domain-containing protein n=1 Tax=Orbilia ellipsospora TaxID=2528407 RepID=A0AAV9X8N8_9PEZI
MPNFLDLPPELRDHVYSLLLSPYSNRRHRSDCFYNYNYSRSLVLFRLNRQIYLESRRIFHKLNTFALISTPWEQARHHVVLDGQVNIVLSEADHFKLSSIHITIKPLYPSPDSDDAPFFNFVILLETGDLDRFCRSWYYSSLNMPYLNAHLAVTLTMYDPYLSASPFPLPGEPHIPKYKQKLLLEPFKQIRQLRSFTIQGDIQAYPSVLGPVEEVMKIPLDPPEKCLEDATKFKELGNEALTSGRYSEAVEYYNKAFFAIHIVIEGKNRRVHADAWFDRLITAEGPFKNQHAGTTRIILRVRLVANTILAYLKLQDYEMAIMTGMRTIKIMRTSIGLDDEEGATDPAMEAMSGFVASGEMGKIYYRTGMAYKAMDNKSEARKLLKVAAIYLPNDKTVKQDLASVSLRLG